MVLPRHSRSRYIPDTSFLVEGLKWMHLTVAFGYSPIEAFEPKQVFQHP
jgi:hypothetical protein